MLIVPDVHGRRFWKVPVYEHFQNFSDSSDDIDRKVIFLGDYLDPYGDEHISMLSAIERFEKIIELKREYPNDVVLLLGNHDWSYIMPEKFSTSRHDSFFEDEVHELFMNNIDMFQLIYQCDVANRNYVFSHAGLHPEWLNTYLGITDINRVAELFNQRPSYIPQHCLDLLTCISPCRGGYSEVGSPIWCDAEEFAYTKITQDYYQIFGHTQQDIPVISSHYACLDCRKVFLLNMEGRISQIGK